jgi:hypothetical protein
MSFEGVVLLIIKMLIYTGTVHNKNIEKILDTCVLISDLMTLF